MKERRPHRDTDRSHGKERLPSWALPDEQDGCPLLHAEEQKDRKKARGLRKVAANIFSRKSRDSKVNDRVTNTQSLARKKQNKQTTSKGDYRSKEEPDVSDDRKQRLDRHRSLTALDSHQWEERLFTTKTLPQNEVTSVSEEKAPEESEVTVSSPRSTTEEQIEAARALMASLQANKAAREEQRRSRSLSPRRQATSRTPSPARDRSRYSSSPARKASSRTPSPARDRSRHSSSSSHRVEERRAALALLAQRRTERHSEQAHAPMTPKRDGTERHDAGHPAYRSKEAHAMKRLSGPGRKSPVKCDSNRCLAASHAPTVTPEISVHKQQPISPITPVSSDSPWGFTERRHFKECVEIPETHSIEEIKQQLWDTDNTLRVAIKPSISESDYKHSMCYYGPVRANARKTQSLSPKRRTTEYPRPSLLQPVLEKDDTNDATDSNLYEKTSTAQKDKDRIPASKTRSAFSSTLVTPDRRQAQDHRSTKSQPVLDKKDANSATDPNSTMPNLHKKATQKDKDRIPQMQLKSRSAFSSIPVKSDRRKVQDYRSPQPQQEGVEESRPTRFQRALRPDVWPPQKSKTMIERPTVSPHIAPNIRTREATSSAMGAGTEHPSAVRLANELNTTSSNTPTSPQKRHQLDQIPAALSDPHPEILDLIGGSIDTTETPSVQDLKKRLWDEEEMLQVAIKPSFHEAPVHGRTHRPKARRASKPKFKSKYYEAAAAAQKKDDSTHLDAAVTKTYSGDTMPSMSNGEVDEVFRVQHLEKHHDLTKTSPQRRQVPAMPDPALSPIPVRADSTLVPSAPSRPAASEQPAIETTVSVAQLVSKLNSVNRSDPQAALHEIDSILRTLSQESSFGIGGQDAAPEVKSTPSPHVTSPEEPHHSSQSSHNTSVSSITNPPFHHPAPAAKLRAPSALNTYTPRAVRPKERGKSRRRRKETSGPFPVTIKVNKTEAKPRRNLDDFVTIRRHGSSDANESDSYAIARKIRVWDEMSGLKGEDQRTAATEGTMSTPAPSTAAEEPPSPSTPDTAYGTAGDAGSQPAASPARARRGGEQHRDIPGKNDYGPTKSTRISSSRKISPPRQKQRKPF